MSVSILSSLLGRGRLASRIPLYCSDVPGPCLFGCCTWRLVDFAVKAVGSMQTIRLCQLGGSLAGFV